MQSPFQRLVSADKFRPPAPALAFISLGQRLTFPFPFVHLQPLDGKLEELLTVETKSHIHGEEFMEV